METAQTKIMKLLLKGKPLTARELAEKAEVTYQTALSVLRDLKGVKKKKIRQGSRGPLANSYFV